MHIPFWLFIFENSFCSFQKYKKAKSWIDGYVIFCPQSKMATLYDEDGAYVTKSRMAKLAFGKELTWESCVLSIEDVPGKCESIKTNTAVKKPVVVASNNSLIASGSLKRRHPIQQNLGNYPASKRTLNASLEPSKQPLNKNKDDSTTSSSLWQVAFTPIDSFKSPTTIWKDGVLKYDHTEQIASLYTKIPTDEFTSAILKKRLDEAEIQIGSLIESTKFIIEVRSQLQMAESKEQATVTEDPMDALLDCIDDPSNIDNNSNSNTTKQILTKTQSNNDSSKVITYELLYTEDLHKKAKRWVDGLLAYNTVSKIAHFHSEQDIKSDIIYK